MILECVDLGEAGKLSESARIRILSLRSTREGMYDERKAHTIGYHICGYFHMQRWQENLGFIIDIIMHSLYIFLSKHHPFVLCFVNVNKLNVLCIIIFVQYCKQLIISVFQLISDLTISQIIYWDTSSYHHYQYHHHPHHHPHHHHHQYHQHHHHQYHHHHYQYHHHHHHHCIMFCECNMLRMIIFVQYCKQIIISVYQLISDLTMSLGTVFPM